MLFGVAYLGSRLRRNELFKSHKKGVFYGNDNIKDKILIDFSICISDSKTHFETLKCWCFFSWWWKLVELSAKTEIFEECNKSAWIFFSNL